MPARHRSIALTVLSVVSVVLPVPGFAQTDNLVPALSRSSSDVVQTYAPAISRVPDDVALPPNLTVSNVYESTVEWMRRRSPTFRRQCARIAKASYLTVVLGGDPPPVSHPVAAWTQITRRSAGRLHATITIAVSTRAVELIAHEIEHIIEQLDGVDLAAKARLASSGVRACACGQPEAFETSRAILIGMRVAAEVSGSTVPLTTSARLRD
jgi:hypothetical protein